MADSSRRYFLVRVLVLQLAALSLWWTVLYNPSLVFLRLAANVPFGLFIGRSGITALSVDERGDWNFSIPVDAVVRDPKQSKDPVSVEAIDFAAPPENIAPFTTGWFVCLALALSVPLSRANFRATAKALAVLIAISVMGLIAYAEINARGTLANMHTVPDPLTVWLLKLAYHIDYLVIPYAAPFFVFLWAHPNWLSRLFGSDSQSV